MSKYWAGTTTFPRAISAGAPLLLPAGVVQPTHLQLTARLHSVSCANPQSTPISWPLRWTISSFVLTLSASHTRYLANAPSDRPPRLP